MVLLILGDSHIGLEEPNRPKTSKAPADHRSGNTGVFIKVGQDLRKCQTNRSVEIDLGFRV